MARGRPRKTPGETSPGATIPHELQHFDHLPASGFVRMPVVKGLLGCSESAIWRNVKNGTIPAPTRLCERLTGWNVGELRTFLERRAAS